MYDRKLISAAEMFKCLPKYLILQDVSEPNDCYGTVHRLKVIVSMNIRNLKERNAFFSSIN